MNELLCFVSNKLDILVHDILVKICADFYDKHQIEQPSKHTTLRPRCVNVVSSLCYFQRGTNVVTTL